MPQPRRIVLGISGASGARYALRLLELLLTAGHTVHLVVTEHGRRLLADETGIRRLDAEHLLPGLARRPDGPAAEPDPAGRLIIHPNRDIGAVIASGSFTHHGMVVLPCSSVSLGAMACGCGTGLLVRAALVTLKERRPLIVCHREMPLSLIDIENMRRLALAGATICSPNPGFYMDPQTVDDLVDFVVGKVLDLLGIDHALKTRWEGERPER